MSYNTNEKLGSNSDSIQIWVPHTTHTSSNDYYIIIQTLEFDMKSSTEYHMLHVLYNSTKLSSISKFRSEYLPWNRFQETIVNDNYYHYPTFNSEYLTWDKSQVTAINTSFRVLAHESPRRISRRANKFSTISPSRSPAYIFHTASPLLRGIFYARATSLGASDDATGRSAGGALTTVTIHTCEVSIFARISARRKRPREHAPRGRRSLRRTRN